MKKVVPVTYAIWFAAVGAVEMEMLLCVLKTRQLWPRMCWNEQPQWNLELQGLCRNDRALMTWICDVKQRNKAPLNSPQNKFCITDIT